VSRDGDAVKEVTVLWIGVVLIVLSVLFPPYGYTRYSVTSIPKNVNLLMNAPELSKPQYYDVPWTYIKHSFLFAIPPATDRELTKRSSQEGIFLHIAHPEDIRVAWHVVYIQIALIALISGAVIVTIRIKRSS
jgi:hypothetical protein